MLREAAEAAARPGTARLRGSLGDQALLDIDGTTGTPRLLTRLDGFLTGQQQEAAAVTLGYVTAHHDALGLTAKDLKTFHLRRDYVDVAGTHHLSWTQKIGGVEVFGNGLTAAVTASRPAGQPRRLPRLRRPPAVPTAAHAASTPPTGAIAPPAGTQGESAAPGRPRRRPRVLFVTRAGTSPRLETITMSAGAPGPDGARRRQRPAALRRSLSSDAAAGDSDGQRRPRLPLLPRRTPKGGNAGVGRLHQRRAGWTPTRPGSPATTRTPTPTSTTTTGAQGVRGGRAVERAPLGLRAAAVPPAANVSFCDNPYPCSWDPNKPFSWQANRKQNAAQVFFFVNNWHDHLLAAPIGFTEAAGNFQLRNRTRGTAGPVTPSTPRPTTAPTPTNGLPDGAHIDNANMDTPPDGQAPTMQMYLQHQPGTSYPDGDPFSPTNVGDEADTVYHEYTHGLSNRLVVDAARQLDPRRASRPARWARPGATGTPWTTSSRQGLQADRRGTGRRRPVPVRRRRHRRRPDRAARLQGRRQPRRPATVARPGTRGGYTYADYGHVIGSPEVHADGEIWSQTLWDLRDALGSDQTESLVTRAMELAPGQPVVPRHAQRDPDRRQRHASAAPTTATIWKVFANRGMGYFAG